MRLKNILLLVAMTFPLSIMSPQSGPKLLFSGENYAWQNQFAKDNGLPIVYSLYEFNFVSSTGLKFDKKLMETYMNKIIPNRDEYGYGMLDWEGYTYNVLAGWVAVTQEEYDEYLNQFIAALRYAKILRPNIKWSYYAYPTFLYAQYSIDITQKHNKRMQLMKELDYLMPSFYLFYDGQTIDNAFYTQYIDANLKYALELGKTMNKEVLPIVWHRYNPGANIPNGNMLIDYSTYKQYIRKIMTTVNFGNKFGGLIWWNSEDYLYSIRYQDPILTEEYKNVTDIDSYKKYILQSYLDTTRVVLSQLPQ